MGLKMERISQVCGPMARGVAAIGSSYIAIGLHTGEVNMKVTYQILHICHILWHESQILNPPAFNLELKKKQVLLLHVELDGNSYICKALGRWSRDCKKKAFCLWFFLLQFFIWKPCFGIKIKAILGFATTSVRSLTWPAPTQGLEKWVNITLLKIMRTRVSRARMFPPRCWSVGTTVACWRSGPSTSRMGRGLSCHRFPNAYVKWSTIF